MPNKSTNIVKIFKKLSHKHALYLILGLAMGVGAMTIVKAQNFSVVLDEVALHTSEVKRFGASLTLSTADNSVNVGDQFTVDITLNTNVEKIDGVDVYSLRYDPKLLDVIDADLAQPGTQISSSGLMPIVVVNRVNERNGLIQFAQVTNGGTTFSGKGKLATVSFKALNKGTADLSFDFIPGKTTDTNVAAYGQDKLRNAASLIIEIK